MLLCMNIKKTINYKFKDGPTQIGMVTWIHRTLPLGVFLLAKGAILWKSKKQTFVALSSTKAEFVVVASATRERV